MRDPKDCRHENSVLVEVGNALSDFVEPVGRICNDCLSDLPIAWGCEDCQWIEAPRRLCDQSNSGPKVVGRLCDEHAAMQRGA